ncbi:MAG: hypothetical protein AAFX50_23590, partial [Acidobacteriota bacterium]
LERVPVAPTLADLDAALALSTGSRFCEPSLGEPAYDAVTLGLVPAPDDLCLQKPPGSEGIKNTLQNAAPTPPSAADHAPP